MEEFSGLHGLPDEWYYLRDGGPQGRIVQVKADRAYTKTDSFQTAGEH